MQINSTRHALSYPERLTGKPTISNQFHFLVPLSFKLPRRSLSATGWFSLLLVKTAWDDPTGLSAVRPTGPFFWMAPRWLTVLGWLFLFPSLGPFPIHARGGGGYSWHVDPFDSCPLWSAWQAAPEPVLCASWRVAATGTWQRGKGAQRTGNRCWEWGGGPVRDVVNRQNSRLWERGRQPRGEGWIHQAVFHYCFYVCNLCCVPPR